MKNNQKTKSLAVNSIYSVLYKLLNVLFPLITATYAAHILMADGIGKVSFAQNIVQYFVIAAALGIPNYGTREIGKNQKNQNNINKTFSELFLINACSTIVCAIIYYTMILSIDYFAENRLLFITVGLSVAMNIFNVDWFYQGKEEYGYITARSFVVKLLSLIFLFVFVRSRNDIIPYALLHCVATAGNYIFNIINLCGKVSFVFKDINIKHHLKPVFILLASSISIELYTLLDTTMLGFWCPDNVIGYYNNATKLARIINSIISSIALVLLPRLSLYFSSGKMDEFRTIANRVLKILIILSVPAAIGLFIVADSIIPVLFGQSFMPAVLTIRILSVLVMAVALNNFFGTQILLTVGQEKKLLISVLIGAGVNVILNSILIIPFQQNGAAIASAISEICVLTATFLFANKYLKFKVTAGYVVSLIVATAAMSAVLIAVKFIHLSDPIELAVSLASGVAVYFIVGWLMKNESVRDFMSTIGRIAQKIIRKKQKAPAEQETKNE